MTTETNDKKEKLLEINEGELPEVTGREAAFIAALRETLSIPSQEGGKTSRRILMAMQVYHENDRP